MPKPTQAVKNIEMVNPTDAGYHRLLSVMNKLNRELFEYLSDIKRENGNNDLKKIDPEMNLIGLIFETAKQSKINSESSRRNMTRVVYKLEENYKDPINLLQDAGLVVYNQEKGEVVLTKEGVGVATKILNGYEQKNGKDSTEFRIIYTSDARQVFSDNAQIARN